MANVQDKSALLVMDVQPGIVERVDRAEEYLTKLSAAVASARKRHIPVIFVVVGFRNSFPEVSSRNKSFSAIKDTALAAMTDPRPAIAATGEDIVVIKRRVSAFAGSDLEVILRAQGIQHLILTGIATSGVVLSTIREAADKDYKLSVLSDLCADFDTEVNSVLLQKVFPRQASVISSDQWIKANDKG
jgi:nicotinamidase-related amidase